MAATYTCQGTPLLLRTVQVGTGVVLHVGGAGSSKSYSVAQLLCKRFLEDPGVKIGITRKTGPALRRTCWALVTQFLREWGWLERCEENKSDMTLRFRGSLMDFFSLDDAEKIKSADFNLIWAEECTEFTHEDYLQLKLRRRSPVRKNYPNTLYLTCNPVDANSWVAQLEGQDDVTVVHSTYHDNPFLDGEYIRTLEGLIGEDPNYYQIYVLGKWGKLENMILSRYRQVDALPEKWQTWGYGLDFGFTNPTALIKVMISDNGVWLDERLYRTKLTNADLIEALRHEERGDVWADSAEPQRIEELVRAGIICYPADKDVKYGLDLLKRTTLNITSSSANLFKEIRGYQYRKDKDGRVLEEPIKFADHGIDAARYGVCGLIGRTGLATQAPSMIRYGDNSGVRVRSNYQRDGDNMGVRVRAGR